MTFFLKPFQIIQPDFEIEDGIRSFNAVIPHEYQSVNMVLGVLAFFHKKDINTTLQIVTSAK